MKNLMKEARGECLRTPRNQPLLLAPLIESIESIESIPNFPLFIIKYNHSPVAFKDRQIIKTWQELINIFTVFCVPTQKQREKPPKNIHRRKSKITNFRYDRGTKVLDYSNVWHVTQE
jgi:hypothetical protein